MESNLSLISLISYSICHTHTHTHVYTHPHTHMYTQPHTHIYPPPPPHTHTLISTPTPTLTHICTHATPPDNGVSHVPTSKSQKCQTPVSVCCHDNTRTPPPLPRPAPGIKHQSSPPGTSQWPTDGANSLEHGPCT